MQRELIVRNADDIVRARWLTINQFRHLSLP